MKILVIANCPSKNTQALQDAVVCGCLSDSDENVNIRQRQPLQADSNDVFWCDGIIIGSTENFGYMSGLIKDFFERTYYSCLEKTTAKPVALYIKGGLDGQGAKTSIEKILTGLRWKLITPTVVLKGEFRLAFLNQCKELGETMTAGLSAGIY